MDIKNMAKNAGNVITDVTGAMSHIHTAASMFAPLIGKKMNPSEDSLTSVPPEDRSKGGLFNINDEVMYNRLVGQLKPNEKKNVCGFVDYHYYDGGFPERRRGFGGFLRKIEAERKVNQFRTIVAELDEPSRKTAEIEEVQVAESTRRSKVRLRDSEVQAFSKQNSNRSNGRGRNRQNQNQSSVKVTLDPAFDKTTTTTTTKSDTYSKKKPSGLSFLKSLSKVIQEMLDDPDLQIKVASTDNEYTEIDLLIEAYEEAVPYLRSLGYPVMSEVSDDDESFDVKDFWEGSKARVGSIASNLRNSIHEQAEANRARHASESGFDKALRKLL